MHWKYTAAFLGALILLLGWFSNPSLPLAATYSVKPGESTVRFEVGFMFGSVAGVFHEVTGSAVVNGGKLQAVSAEIHCASVDTQREVRDEHLRSDHFFDCEKHPLLRFVSTDIEKLADNDYRVKGNLTLRGINQEVTLKGIMTAAANGKDYAFQAGTEVDRQAWKISWNQTTRGRDVLIQDNVALEVKGVLQPAPE